MRALALTLLLVAAPLAAGEASDRAIPAVAALGQVLSQGAVLDGIPVPPGTTLLSPALLETTAEPVVVRLANGLAVAVAGGSSVALEGDGDGGMALSLSSGTMMVRQSSGAVLALSQNGSIAFDQEGQIQEGTPVGEEEDRVRLCELEDSTPEKFELCTVLDPDANECDWDLLVVDEADVPRYLGISAVYAGKDRNDLGLDDDCEEEVPVVIIPQGGGLGPLALAGIAGASGLFSLVAIDQLEGDDEPLSPVTPQ